MRPPNPRHSLTAKRPDSGHAHSTSSGGSATHSPMTTDLNSMHGIASRAASANELPDAWPSGGSTTSLTMDDDDDDDGEQNENDDGNRKYERKTRRFAWPDELHRLFVAAIFDLGLKNASPKALMPFMQPTATDAGLTTEHLKSHLQKYRLNYEKSRSEFLAFYDESAKRNGRRRRRTAKCMESHTRFIFPITPAQPSTTEPSSTDPRLKIDAGAMRSDAAPESSYYAAYAHAPLSPRTRQDRANLLRLAQHNAAVAFATQSAMGGFDAAQSPNDVQAGVDGVSEAQWGMLASLLSPGTSGGGAPSLNERASSEMQLQMHLAMQAQMNLHRQMMNRKVAVSQHYYNQAAAVKRAAASAMVERALQNASNPQQQQPPSGRYNASSRYIDPPMAVPSSRPSIDDNGMMPHHHQQQQMLMPQQQNHQQPQRYATSSQADALLGPPWDPMDIDMGLNADEQSDLFGFLKSNE